MTTPTRHRPNESLHRLGFVAAAIGSLLALWVVHQLPHWDRPGFVTDEVDEVLPHLTASLVASAAFDLVWAWRRPPWLVHVGRLVISVTAAVACGRIWQVYPLDLAAAWDVVVRTLLGVAFVGSTIGAISRLFELVGAETDPV